MNALTPFPIAAKSSSLTATAYRALEAAIQAGMPRSEALWRLEIGLSEALNVFKRGQAPTSELFERLRHNEFILDMGLLPEAPAGGDARVSLTFGTYTDPEWTNVRELTWADLAEILTQHKAGKKEGTCAVPAVFRGKSRKKEEAAQIDVLMLDSDSGHTLEEIEAAVRRFGWTAIIASSYSNGTTETKASKANYSRFLASHPGAGAAEYLQSKGYLPRVTEGAKVLREDDEHVYLKHAPCPKFRIVLRLARPWRAADYPDQDTANAAWVDLIVATAAALGLHHDQACTDTSRLFYLPRHPEGETPVSRVIPGKACDPWALPKIEQTQAADRGSAVAPELRNREIVVAETGEVLALDLVKWGATHGPRFKIAEALKARQPSVLAGYTSDKCKHHILCPFEDEHTNAGADRATIVINAGESDTGGFAVHCRHAHCTGRDRLMYVRRMLEEGWLQQEDLTNPEFLLPEPDPTEAAVDELNARHAVVRVGGRTMVLTESQEADGRVAVVFSRPNDVRDWYVNDTVQVPGAKGELKAVSKFDLWFKSPRRRQYERVVCEPAGAPGNQYNLWRGFAVQPDPKASCKLFLAHLRDNVCRGDAALFRWLMAFFADMVQRPGVKPGVALVMRGGQGVGKSIVGGYVGALFPAHYVVVSQAKHLVGSFNMHLKDALLIQAEEAFWAGDKAAEGALKHLVTSEKRMLEPKGVDPFEVRDFARLIVTSNSPHVVPAGVDERRFAVFDVGDAKKQDTAYFAAIAQEMRNGGTGALLHELQNFDLSTVNVREIPRTEALLDQKLASLEPFEIWLHTRLREGAIGYSDGWPQEIERKAIYENYRRFVDDMRKYPISEAEFGRRLKGTFPRLGSKQLRLTDGARPRAYVLPPLLECRSAFEQRLGQTLDWEG
jgi:hypothetical protein